MNPEEVLRKCLVRLDWVFQSLRTLPDPDGDLDVRRKLCMLGVQAAKDELRGMLDAGREVKS